MRKIIYREDNMTFMCQIVDKSNLNYAHPFYLKDLNHYETNAKLKIECDIFDLQKVMDPELTKIPRLVKEDSMNDNGYLFEKTSLNREISKFIKSDASLRLDDYNIEDLNDLLSNDIIPDNKFKKNR